MSVFATYLVRDEADIIASTIGRILDQVDKVIVLDNGSADGTREILDELDCEVLDDGDPAHWQGRKMTWLAARAASQGADWVLACDADEVWYSPHGRIDDVLAKLDAAVAPVRIYDHRATGADGSEADPLERMGWRQRDALPLHKIACRPVLPVTIGEGNHSADYPTQRPAWDQVVIRHFPIRSVEQFIRKARKGGTAIALTTLPNEISQHWRDWNKLSDEQLEDVFYEHYWFAAPEKDPNLIFDPAP